MIQPERETVNESSNPTDAQALFRSISENFSGVYLTMLSIIQGVALTDLSSVTFSSRAQFTVVHWIQVAVMLWSVIYIWTHFMSDALMTQWIPDLEDAVLLFGTGVFEIVANHAIVWGVTVWLSTGAIMLFLWALGNFYIRAQEERVVRDPVLMEILRRRTRPLVIETLGGAVILGILAAICRVTLADPHSVASEPRIIALVSVALAFAVNIAIGVTSTLFWKIVRNYDTRGSDRIDLLIEYVSGGRPAL